MEKRFTGTGVTHFHRITFCHHGVFHEIVVNQSVDGVHADVSRDVAGFELAKQLVDDNSVHDFNCDFSQELVGSMHWVTKLEGRYSLPTLFLENFSGFRRCSIEFTVLLRETTLGQHLHWPGQVIFALSHDLLDARMFHVVRRKNLLAFKVLVDLILLSDTHCCHYLVALCVNKRYFVAFFNFFVIC